MGKKTKKQVIQQQVVEEEVAEVEGEGA